MKILEAQSAVLTNYEVYEFLKKKDIDYKKPERGSKGPQHFQALRAEVLRYLEEHPGPLSQKPLTYNSESITKLLERLRDYEIAKGEMIMIINLRPTSIAILNTVIEEMEERFSEAQQEDIVNGITEILGDFDPPADEAEE